MSCDERPGNLLPENREGYQVETEDGCTRILYPGGTLCRLYQVVPGIILSLVHVEAEELPSMNSAQSACIFTVNYSRNGICEMQTEDGNYLCVKGGELCISRELPDRHFRYPSGSYDGVEIFVLKKAAEDPSGMLDYFHIDARKIAEQYPGSGKKTLIAERADVLEEDLQEICVMADEEHADGSLLALRCLHMLRMLSAGRPLLQEAHVSALAPAQLAMAEKAERILMNNLETHIPIRVIAEEMGISETSLKNYFRAVYGRNVSDYLLRARMTKAKELLRESRLSVGEIAVRTGYKSQSRFDDAFRRYTGMTPVKWRRTEETGKRNLQTGSDTSGGRS